MQTTFTIKDAINCFKKIDKTVYKYYTDDSVTFDDNVKNELGQKKKNDFEDYLKTCNSENLRTLYDRMYSEERLSGVFPKISIDISVWKQVPAEPGYSSNKEYLKYLKKPLKRLKILEAIDALANNQQDQKNNIELDTDKLININQRF